MIVLEIDNKKLIKLLKNINGSEKRILHIGNNLNEELTQKNATVINAVAGIILRGVFLQASDIHIEPQKECVRIRYRIDGLLLTDCEYNINIHNQIVSRIKTISELDITNFTTPQDGKFKRKIDDNYIDFRVSTIPTTNGEKVAIRILSREIVDFDLENLGFTNDEYEKILKLISKKSGMLLASGPTGSGKTSLLYSILKKINRDDINITTVEDPVEYEIDGINQVDISHISKLGFGEVLKSFLRQDPDILMIGEIRDKETAEIGVKSALTGHLVLSTIHTSDAIGGISRLLNIGIQNYEISATINGIIAQRLVRKLCPHCKTIDEQKLAKLSFLGVDTSDYTDEIFYTAKGCEYCKNSGYIGRIPIFEIFLMDEKIKNLIDNCENIRPHIKIKTIMENGITKAKNGLTSLDEIIRVC